MLNDLKSSALIAERFLTDIIGTHRPVIHKEHTDFAVLTAKSHYTH
jgi:hypothetical protein